jgi:hypothetical protein
MKYITEFCIFVIWNCHCYAPILGKSRLRIYCHSLITQEDVGYLDLYGSVGDCCEQAPATFSQLQIEAYLKTVAFRREINNVQKAAAGRGVGGVPSTRIASATNREFIFSSSYQGDKM